MKIFEIVRDVLSVGLAGLGAYLAYLAIRMGKEQGKTAERQAQIAETQHAIMQQQMARKAELRLHLFKSDSDCKWNVCLQNTGTKSAHGCYWNLLFPAVHHKFIKVSGEPCDELKSGPDAIKYKDELLWPVQGILTRPIHPKSVVQCACIELDTIVTSNPGLFLPFVWKWDVTGEDGAYPETEFAEIIWNEFA